MELDHVIMESGKTQSTVWASGLGLRKGNGVDEVRRQSAGDLTYLGKQVFMVYAGLQLIGRCPPTL